MKQIKQIATFYLLPLVAVLIVLAFTFGCESSSKTNHLCKQEYALCTSAPCIPVPGDPSKAICFCDVEKETSMSTVPCDALKPSTDAKGIRTIYSTFSLKEFLVGKKSLKCPSGTPWTWCLNKRCTVDPANPKQAICTCDVMRTGEWTTLGGDCDTSTCTNGYWSGASLHDLEEGSAFMTKALGLEQSPAKWCPASE